MKTALVSVLLCLPLGFGQNLDQEDIVLGLNTHAKILQNSSVMTSSEIVSAVEDVYRNMSTTVAYTSGTSVLPSLFVMDSSVINAYATAGGRMYVNRGLVQAVQGSPGILAFVLGHEMVHNRNHHGLNRVIRASQAQQNIRLAYRQNSWAGLAVEVAQKIAEAKSQRDEEHEADQMGLLMAAEAGYHPDFAILAARLLRTKTGESSKFSAFFEGHPRWTTREQRAEGTRIRALALFEEKWPDASKSPGGVPPTMAAVEDFKIERGKGLQGTILTAFTDVRHVQDRAVRVEVVMTREKRAPQTILSSETFAESQEKRWSIVLGKRPKDHFGKRFVRIVARLEDGEILYETEAKKVD